MKLLSQHALNIGIVGLFALSAEACTVQTDVDENLGANVQDLVVSGFVGFGQISPKTFISAPAVVARGSNVIDVFATDSSNQIFINSWVSATGWAGWSVLPGGGTFPVKPAATAIPDGSQMFVAARGFDSKLYVKPWKLSGSPRWGAWSVIGTSTFSTAPALAYNAVNGTLFLFARKSDLSVYWATNNISGGYNAANWTAFTAISGGSSFSEPAAVFDGSNVVVATRRGDDFFWTTKFNGLTWSSWSQIPGGTFKFAPALSSWGSGHLDVFGVGMDDAIYFNSRDGGGAFVGYQAIPGGTFSSGPAAWSSISMPNRIRLAAKGKDNAIYLNSYVQ